MIRSKRTLVVLGLCAVVVGLAVLGTGASQAEKGAKWSLINTKGELLQVSEGLLPEVAMTEIVTEDMTLLTELLKNKVALLCLGATFINAKLELEGKVGGGNKVRFTNCTIKINGVTNAECKPHTTGEAAGTLLSSALKGLLVLFEGKSIIRFEPVAGTTFLTLQFGGECAIGESCTINGFSSVTDVENAMNVEQVSHVVEQLAPASELWVGSKTAEHMATVDGQGRLGLSGAHVNLKWAGTAG